MVRWLVRTAGRRRWQIKKPVEFLGSPRCCERDELPEIRRLGKRALDRRALRRVHSDMKYGGGAGKETEAERHCQQRAADRCEDEAELGQHLLRAWSVPTLVSRFRSSHHSPAHSHANFGIEGAGY
jgi:hypothetical protein